MVMKISSLYFTSTVAGKDDVNFHKVVAFLNKTKLIFHGSFQAHNSYRPLILLNFTFLVSKFL